MTAGRHRANRSDGSAKSNGKANGQTNSQTQEMVLGDRTYQHLPPRPPQVHQAVYQCDRAEVISFTEELDWLRTLLQVSGVPTESLAAAAIRDVYSLRDLDRDWLIRAGRMVSVLLKDDYDRLRMILSQIHP